MMRRANSWTIWFFSEWKCVEDENDDYNSKLLVDVVMGFHRYNVYIHR